MPSCPRDAVLRSLGSLLFASSGGRDIPPLLFSFSPLPPRPAPPPPRRRAVTCIVLYLPLSGRKGAHVRARQLTPIDFRLAVLESAPRLARSVRFCSRWLISRFVFVANGKRETGSLARAAIPRAVNAVPGCVLGWQRACGSPSVCSVCFQRVPCARFHIDLPAGR